MDNLEAFPGIVECELPSKPIMFEVGDGGSQDGISRSEADSPSRQGRDSFPRMMEFSWHSCCPKSYIASEDTLQVVVLLFNRVVFVKRYFKSYGKTRSHAS